MLTLQDPTQDILRVLSRPKVFSLSATSSGASETSIRLRVGTGKHSLQVCMLVAWQLSGGDRASYWSLWDTNGLVRFLSGTKASGERFYVKKYDLIGANVPSNESRYIRYSWSALGAGEVGYMLGIALETDLRCQ